MQDQVQEHPQIAKAAGAVLLQVTGLKVAYGGIQAVKGWISRCARVSWYP